MINQPHADQPTTKTFSENQKKAGSPFEYGSGATFPETWTTELDFYDKDDFDEDWYNLFGARSFSERDDTIWFASQIYLSEVDRPFYESQGYGEEGSYYGYSPRDRQDYSNNC